MYFKLCIWCVCGASHASHALSKTTLQLMEISGVAGLLPGAAGLPGCCRGAAGVLPGAAGCCRVLPGVAGYLPSHRLSWSVLPGCRVPDPRDKFVAAVSTSALPNGAVFSSRPSSAASFGNFQTIRRARREAGTRPRSPRFKSRAGTPHPPLHQPSGAESTTMNGSSRALVCELHERATRPTR
jgi:hypothetical protein